MAVWASHACRFKILCICSTTDWTTFSPSIHFSGVQQLYYKYWLGSRLNSIIDQYLTIFCYFSFSFSTQNSACADDNTSAESGVRSISTAVGIRWAWLRMCSDLVWWQPFISIRSRNEFTAIEFTVSHKIRLHRSIILFTVPGHFQICALSKC